MKWLWILVFILLVGQVSAQTALTCCYDLVDDGLYEDTSCEQLNQTLEECQTLVADAEWETQQQTAQHEANRYSNYMRYILGAFFVFVVLKFIWRRYKYVSR